MKTNELRIGNFIHRNGIMEVVGLKTAAIKIYDHHNKIPNSNWFQPEGFTGISITEDWLVKFGFTSTINETYINGKEFVLLKDNIEFNGIGGRGWINKKNDYLCVNTLCRGNYCANSVEYVHQLQNLYFSLTGEELFDSLN